MFTTVPLEDAVFPSVQCPQCQNQVLTWQDLNEQGTLQLRCLDCDHILSDSPEAQAWTDKDLAREGYKLEGYRGDHTPGGCGEGHCSS